MLGMRWTGIPSRGDKKYSKSLHATEAGDKRRPDGPLGLNADFTLQHTCTGALDSAERSAASSTGQRYRILHHAIKCTQLQERHCIYSRFNKKDVSFSCVCPVIDNEFRHNIVKVVVDPQTL